ncbi:putative sulfoacetate transporter SauU [bacterium HR23]|nr:putative sulfoacetate transporter SauU [bacterium HR23]
MATSGLPTVPAVAFPVRMLATVLTLALGWVFIYLDRTTLYPLLPVIGKEFRLTGTQQGAIASAYFFTYVALQMPSGVLGDRFGLKRVLMAMYALAGLGMLAIGLLARSYPLLLVFVALHAVGAGAYYSTSYGITVSSVTPERRGVSSAIVTVGMASGLALGLSLPPLLYQAMGSWRGPFVLLGFCTLALLPMFWVGVQGRPMSAGPAGSLGRLFRHRGLVLLGIASFFILWSQWVTLTWAPSFLYQERGLNLRQAGLYSAVVALPGVVGALTWGRLSDRLGRRRLLGVLLPFTVASLVGVALLRQPALLALALGGFGLTGALALNPLIVSWAGDMALKRPDLGVGTAIAGINALAVGSSIVAPVVSGRILDITGSLEGAFFLGALCVAVGWAILWAVPEEGVEGRGRAL